MTDVQTWVATLDIHSHSWRIGCKRDVQLKSMGDRQRKGKCTLNSDEYEFKFIGHKANECKGREELEALGYVDLPLPKALECNTSDQLFGGRQTEKNVAEPEVRGPQFVVTLNALEPPQEFTTPIHLVGILEVETTVPEFVSVVSANAALIWRRANVLNATDSANDHSLSFLDQSIAPCELMACFPREG